MTKRNIKIMSSLGVWYLMIHFALSGCSGKKLNDGKKAEKLGRYSSAISNYEGFIKEHPNHSKIPEAMFRIGEIYRHVIQDYEKAQNYYESLIENFSKSEWANAAKLSSMNSPDYFPFEHDRVLIYGDSQTGGDIFRKEEVFESIKDQPNKIAVKSNIFAGTKLAGLSERLYEKDDLELREYLPNSTLFTVILRYPPKKGKRWESLRDGKRVVFTIEDDNAVVKLRSETIRNCLKVKYRQVDYRLSWKYEYYAPDIGLILTTFGTKRGESRLQELQSYTRKEKFRSVAVPDAKKSSSATKIKNWFNIKFKKKKKSTEKK